MRKGSLLGSIPLSALAWWRRLLLVSPVCLAAFWAVAATGQSNCAGTFQPGVSFSVPDGSFTVAAGDFNGDSKLDLVLTNYHSASVSLLIGNGNGSFQTAVTYPVGADPFFLVAADLNSDGKLDLAVANNSGLDAVSHSISILLGNGDGTFQPAVNYAVGSAPYGVAVSDFNGDGKLDLAVTNSGDNNISILLGNGNGTFQSAVNYPVCCSPVAVAAGDFNRDGKPDLVVGKFWADAGANAYSDKVSVLLGKGDGTFQAPVEYDAGIFAVSIAVGDFNADGKLDLAVANLHTDGISVLLGNGDGTFQGLANYTVYAGPAGIVAIDLNSDGKLDLAVAKEGTPAVDVLLGTGTGTFQPAVGYQTIGSNHGIAAGDFNGDGRPDLALPSFDLNRVEIFLGRLLPSVTIAAAGPTTFCTGGSVTLTATPSGGSSSFTAYQWYLNGVAIQGATSSTRSATVSGIYTATVTDSTGCTSVASNRISVMVNGCPTDSDGDGVLDVADQCPLSNLAATVIIDGCDSAVRNVVDANGCTTSDKIALCANSAGSHGEFVSCVAAFATQLKQSGMLTGQQAGEIVRCAGSSRIP